jgi:hypothetical protein
MKYRVLNKWRKRAQRFSRWYAVQQAGRHTRWTEEGRFAAIIEKLASSDPCTTTSDYIRTDLEARGPDEDLHLHARR